MPGPTQNPHDALFKHVFSHPKRAAEELRHVLPDRVARHIDWQTLEPLPGSFVDDELRERHADLLYRVRLGGRPAFIYILLEHKSHDDPLAVPTAGLRGTDLGAL
jgi:predicted transposase YdaD